MSSTIEQAMIAATPTEIVSGQPPPVSKEGLRTFATVVSGEVAAVAESVTTDRRILATWAGLAAIVGTHAAQGAEVLDSDSGTHTDPVVGGTVANAGVYSWSVSPAGWKRIGSIGISSKADKTTALGGSGLAVASGTLGASPAIDVPAASASDVYAGTATDKAVTPAGFASGVAYALGQIAEMLRIYNGSTGDLPLIVAPNGVLLGVRSSSGEPYGSIVDRLRLGASTSLSTPVLLDDVDFDRTAAWLGLIVYGQSNAVGARGTPLISTTQPYAHKTFAGGPKTAVGTGTAATKALVEDTLGEAGATGTNRGETPLSQAARQITEMTAEQDAISPAGVVVFGSAPGEGGKRLDELDAGSTYWTRLLGHIDAAVARAGGAGKDLWVVVSLIQGEADAIGGTSQSAYAATLAAFWSDLDAAVRARTGQAGAVHLLVSLPTYYAAANAGPLLAFQSAIASHGHIHLVAPMYFLPYHSDQTHLTAIGHALHGRYIGRAAKRVAIDRARPDRVWPVSAVCRGTTLRVAFEVPRAPIVIDNASIGPATAAGFKVVDGTGAITILAVAASGEDVVTLTLARAPTGTTVVRYALDHLGSGVGIEGGTSGNVRDSTADTCVIDGTVYALPHWAPPFEIAVSLLEDAS